MCGRGGVVDDATTTSRQGCGESTGRQVQEGPETGQRGPRRQAERRIGSLKSQEAEIKELRAQNEHYRKQSGGRSAGRTRPSTQKRKWHGGMVALRMRSRADRSWMSKGKKRRKSCETLKNSRVCRKEVQDSLKNDPQQQLHKVDQRRHDLMPEHQRAQKGSHKIQSIQDKRRNLQKESTAAQEEMRKIREDTVRNEECFRQLSGKVDENNMADAEMAAELQGLQAGGERRGSDASQTGN